MEQRGYRTEEVNKGEGSKTEETLDNKEIGNKSQRYGKLERKGES